MNKELFLVFLPALSWVLFALGGTQISDKAPGWKGWRRFILPFVYIIACFIGSIIWWKSLLVGMIAAGSYSLGYGKEKTWLQRSLVGLSYGLVSMPIGVSVWNVFTAIAFISLFFLSNTKLTEKIFVWKICEGFFGLFVGIQVSYLLAGNGLIW